MTPERASDAPNEHIAFPSSGAVRWRGIVSELLGILMPHTVEVIGDGLIKAEKYLSDGWGLVVLYNHFSKRDPFQVIKDVVFEYPAMKRRPAASPIAYHQFHNHRLVVSSLSKLTDTSLHPIVVQDTVDAEKTDGLGKGTGIPEYTKRTAQVLGNNGIVPLPLQPGRRQSLSQTSERNVEFLIRTLKRKKVTNVAYLFVGVGIQGKETYEPGKTDRYLLGETFNLKIGPTYTQEEIETYSQQENMSVDKWIARRFEPLVPEQYRSPADSR